MADIYKPDLGTKLAKLFAFYQPTQLNNDDESKYQSWIKDNKITDPDAITPGAGTYDYRGAFKGGVEPPTEDGGHWTSDYKMPGHPNEFIPASAPGWGGDEEEKYGNTLLDTKTGNVASLLQLLGMK